MPKVNHESYDENHQVEGVRLLYKIIIPVVFLTAGLILLSLRIAGWSIIFGLPLIVFGTVFLVYTYDELVTKKVKPYPERMIKCSICKKPTPRRYPWQDVKEVICRSCEKNIETGIRKEKDK